MPLARRTFRALRHRNYRLYFSGQVASFSGTWMQIVAQAWLVLELTDSGVALGIATALQFGPLLVIGPYGGVIADRFDKRKVVMATQAAAGVLALALALLTATDVVRLWHVYVLAFALGVATALDNPARQSLVHDMVGPDDLPNAVSLNTVVFNASRIVGPAIAGVVIAKWGVTPCFLVNAASYAAVVVALALMHTDELHTEERPADREPARLLEGLRYVAATPALRTPLLMMVVLGTLAYEFQVTLPLFAKRTFDGGAGTYGLMNSMIAVGAVVGGLFSASRGAPTPRRVIGSAFLFGVLMLGAAGAPTLPAALVLLTLMGAPSIVFIAVANATLQLNSAPEMRGRVMALWGTAFFGTTLVGGPIVGWLAEEYGARASIAVGGAATVLTALFAAKTWLLRGVRSALGSSLRDDVDRQSDLAAP